MYVHQVYAAFYLMYDEVEAAIEQLEEAFDYVRSEKTTRVYSSS